MRSTSGSPYSATNLQGTGDRRKTWNNTTGIQAAKANTENFCGCLTNKYQKGKKCNMDHRDTWYLPTHPQVWDSLGILFHFKFYLLLLARITYIFYAKESASKYVYILWKGSVGVINICITSKQTSKFMNQLGKFERNCVFVDIRHVL